MKPVLLLFVIVLCSFTSSLYAQTPRYTVANGEYQNFILDNSTQTLYGNGLGATGIGSNTGQPGLPILCQFPSANTKIKFVAGGLHSGSCIDVNGNVYFTGLNEDGTMGNGTVTGGAGSFVQVTSDSMGNPFTGVSFLRMGSSIFSGGQGYGEVIYAIKNDGTLWVWGNTQGGYRGDGTYGRVNPRPVQVPFPAGTVITKVVFENVVIALDANGNVWTWAGNGAAALLGNTSQANYETPHIISLPSAAMDIAGGGFFSYALLKNHSLYGWGWYTGYLGVGSSSGSNTPGLNPPNKPMLLDTSLNLPSPIVQITANNTTTYVILSDGTMWAWGGNECGQVGNGQEINWSKYTTNPAPYGGATPTPYNWNQDLSTAQLQQHKPVQIAPGLNNFVSLSEGSAAVWYEFAVDANGQLYSWGRNKNGVLANGVVEGDYVLGTLAANYPNSYDVPYVTAINPFSMAKNILSSSPQCISVPGSTYCNAYAIPANTAPSAMVNGVKNGSENVTGVDTMLDGTASTDNVAIVYYIWSQVSGPGTPIISIPSGKKVNILGLTTGSYVFKLKVIDNGWLKDSTTFTLNVNTGGAQAPLVNAGSNQSITLPVNSATLTGSATDAVGTITGYQWTQVSGPSAAGFGSASLAQTTATGMVAGVYVFKLTVTNNVGQTGTATVQVTVNPAVAGPPVSNAGTAQTITLPVNSVTLAGSGSEANGTIVSYTWTELSGPSAATITTATKASTTVTGLVQGVYSFQLTVTDALGVKATDAVKVTVNAAVAGPPVSNAGTAQTITLPTNSVTLTGSGSETNGTIVSYGWTELSGPSAATITSASTASTSVTGLVQGVYSFQLTVTDALGVQATDAVKITVNAAAVGSPVANAGLDQTITLPVNSVTLAGSGSETNGTIVSYVWTELSGPSTATITTASQASTNVTGLIQGVYSFQLTITDALGVKAMDAIKVTVNPAVVIPGTPVAVAGADQTITLPLSSVTLSGSGSETGGTIVSYAWVQTSGPSTATITNPSQAGTTVTALVQGVYTFQLTVKDNSGVTATDVMKVTVNAAVVVPVPVANAGPDQTITLPTNSVTLSGSGSESGGTIVSYTWTQTSGPSTATITTPSQAQTTITALVQGVYTFVLTVKDNSGVTATDVAKVTVNPAPTTPVPLANAGADQTITLPTNSVTLGGSGSESGGTIVGYAWTQTSGPSTATITNPLQAGTTVTALVQGVYTFELTVKDNAGNTANDVIKVTVNAAAISNQPPVANAGPNQTITAPITVLDLDGSASYDPDGTIASYDWVQLSGGGGITITNSSSALPSIYGLLPGAYVFQLTVTDNMGASATATVTITVVAPVDVPVAIAGPDTSMAYPASIANLNGSASYEQGGTIVSYGWTQLSGPAAAVFSDSAAAATSVQQLQTGSYVFQLTVTDSKGDTATSTVTVTVLNTLRISGKEIMSIYPNPFPGNVVYVNAQNDWMGPVKVMVRDCRGQLLTSYEFDKETTNFNQMIQMPNRLAVGVYLLILDFHGQQLPEVYQLIKQ